MRRSPSFIAAACLAGVLLAAPATRAQHADREQIIDIQRLNEVMARATNSLAEPLRETTLGDRFAEVNALLQDDQVDKRALQELAGKRCPKKEVEVSLLAVEETAAGETRTDVRKDVRKRVLE